MHPGNSENYLPTRAELFHQPHSLHTGARPCPLISFLPKGPEKNRNEGIAMTRLLPTADKNVFSHKKLKSLYFNLGSTPGSKNGT